MSKTSKPVKTESRLTVARDWKGGNWAAIANEYEVSFWCDERVQN